MRQNRRNEEIIGKRNLIPMNIQLFAEEGVDASSDNSTPELDVQSKEVNSAPDEELMKQLSDIKAELLQEKTKSERYKNSIDKLTKANGELTKQVRENMNPEELKKAIMQEAENARKEAEAEKDAEIQALRERIDITDSTAFWGGKTIGMDDELAKSTAEAEVKGDKEKFRDNIVKHIKTIKDNSYHQALKDRGEIKAGNGEPDKNAAAKEAAAAAAKRVGTANQDILNHYRRR